MATDVENIFLRPGISGHAVTFSLFVDDHNRASDAGEIIDAMFAY
jgi:hypothetical protein